MLELLPQLDTLKDLRAAFQRHGFDIRVVGGCVRDLMLGKVPADIDLCTNATPEEQHAIYEAEKINHHPTGLQHGTWTVVLYHGEARDQIILEVTSLRIDTDTDGRHATVTYTHDWNLDLSRRDLTINAMALTLDGELIDPFDGATDLANGRVVFVGNAEDRIREDYLRVLRWFRFSARYYTDHILDMDTLNIVADNAPGLQRISRERVWMEMAKIVSGRSGPLMVMAMAEYGITQHIDLPEGAFNTLTLAHQFTNDPVTLMAAYCSAEAGMIETLATKWKWSADERYKGKNICHNLMHESFTLADAKRQTVLGNDKAWGVQTLLAKCDKASAAILEAWDVPVLPVAGADLVAAGMKPGPNVGITHRMMRDRWIDSNYTMTKNDLLQLIPEEV